MPTWPADHITTIGLSTGTPSQARAELLAVAQAVTGMLAYSPALKGAANAMGVGIPPDARWGAGIDLVQIANVTIDPVTSVISGNSMALFSMLEAGKQVSGLAIGAYHDGTHWRAVSFFRDIMVFYIDDAGGITYKSHPWALGVDSIVTFADTQDLATPRGALYTNAVLGPLVTGQVQRSIVFSSQGYDSHGFGVSAVPVGELSIPDGITQVKIAYSIRFSAYNDEARGFDIGLYHNNMRLNQLGLQGQTFTPSMHTGAHALNIGVSRGATGMIPVASLDSFDLRFSIDQDPTQGTLILLGPGSWFAIEVIA